MKLQLIAVAIAGLSVAACQTVPSQPAVQTKPYNLNASETAAVKKGVTASLKDPTSAIFSGDFKAVEDVSKPGIIYVCGLVNGKNSFGGYVGNQPFMGILGTMAGGKISTFNVTSMGGTDTDTFVTMSMCRRYGVVS